MGRRAGTNLSNDHRENISNGMKRKHEETRAQNRRNFMNSMFAHQRRDEAANEAADATAVQEEAQESQTEAAVPLDNPTVENFVEADPQPIVPNLDVEDDAPDEPATEDGDETIIKGTIMHKYIHSIQDRLQVELSRNFGATDEPWLLNLLKASNWWIRKQKFKHVCTKLNLEFEQDQMESAYFRDVYVWLPDERWGKEYMPACPECKVNDRVGNNGFRDNHFGRRVVALDHDYYCLSRRYRCSKCENDLQEEKKRLQESAARSNLEILGEIRQTRHYTFMAWNRTTLQLYPCGRGSEFPAFLTYKAGVDRLVVDLMRPLFDKGLRPNALADTILELHAKAYHNQCLNHELELAQTHNCLPRKSMLSEFGDKSKYNGAVPTSRYLMHVYKEFHATITDFLDTEVKKRGARRIHVDASYKEAKHLCQYHGHNLFKGLITITNEHAEIRSQFHVVTDDHEQLRPALIAFAKTQQAYGQPDVELLFTDNVKGDKNFYLEMFPSLKVAQARLDELTDKTTTGAVETTTTTREDHPKVCTIDNNQIHVLWKRNDMETFITALDHMIKKRAPADQIIGLDAEWNVELGRRGIPGKHGKLALLILAYMDDEGKPQACLLRLHKLSSLPDPLLKLLVGSATFVGRNIGGDISKIGRDFKCVREMEKVTTVELGRFARTRDAVTSGTVGLDVLVAACLNEVMSKDAEIRISNRWEAPRLSQAQMKYAALDGVKSMEVYFFLRDKPDLTKRLSLEEAKTGTSVDIAPLRSDGGVSILATRCAIGTLTAQTRETFEVPQGMRLSRQRITNRTHKVVEVHTVLAPHFIVPSLKKQNGEPVCLGDFTATPFFVILPLQMLKNHVDSVSIRPFPNMLEPMTAGPTPPASMPRNSVPQIATVDTAGGTERTSDDDDLLDEDLLATNVLDEIDEDAEAAGLQLSENDIALLKRVCIHGERAASGQILLPCEHLEEISVDEIYDVFSVILGDPFHAIDRPKTPHDHCANKMYRVAFRDALLQFDPIILQRVIRAVKEKDGKTDRQVEESMYFNASFWKECVPRRILPPRLLYWRVRAVFVAFGNFIDPKSQRPLFNKAAWEKANNILKEIRLGYYSDPPGYSFYTTKFNEQGEPRINAYGFELLYCSRGTTDVELTHKIVITTFGTWHCGIEMSDCLLRERRHRHNQRCSENRRSGFPRIGHYDTWMIDKYQLLVQANHGIILYPHWVNASDYKSTPETFGTIALHDEELAKKLEDVISEETVQAAKLTHDMKYLCRVMGTKLPLLPVHTKAERKLFRQLILRDIKDERQQALAWVDSVNGIDIFPKLPVHLRNYRNRFDRNARARQAFEDASKSREILDSLNETLCPAPSQEATDDGGNLQDDVMQPSDYTMQWEPIAEPQPLLPPAPIAIDPRNTFVGGMVIDKAPEVMLERVVNHIKRSGKRGRDNPQRKRAIRRCSECVKRGVPDEEARLCAGTNNRTRCKHYVKE